MADALTKKAQYTINIVVITQLNILRGLENLNVQSVPYGQASKNLNGSNSFKLEPIVLYNLGPTFAFTKSCIHRKHGMSSGQCCQSTSKKIYMKHQGKNDTVIDDKIIFWVMKMFFNIQCDDMHKKTLEIKLLEPIKKLC